MTHPAQIAPTPEKAAIARPDISTRRVLGDLHAVAVELMDSYIRDATRTSAELGPTDPIAVAVQTRASGAVAALDQMCNRITEARGGL